MIAKDRRLLIIGSKTPEKRYSSQRRTLYSVLKAKANRHTVYAKHVDLFFEFDFFLSLSLCESIFALSVYEYAGHAIIVEQGSLSPAIKN